MDFYSQYAHANDNPNLVHSWRIVYATPSVSSTPTILYTCPIYYYSIFDCFFAAQTHINIVSYNVPDSAGLYTEIITRYPTEPIE